MLYAGVFKSNRMYESRLSSCKQPLTFRVYKCLLYNQSSCHCFKQLLMLITFAFFYLCVLYLALYM